MNRPGGFHYHPGFLSLSQQKELVRTIEHILIESPLFKPRMPRTGRPFSVEMSNCGKLGWVSDKESGYRYQSTHPETGEPWPPMPDLLLQLWRELTGYLLMPEACLINWYQAKAKMGLHKDQDEEDFNAPVLSISLGDSAMFKIGGQHRSDPTETLELKSGDIVLLAGESRLAYHGITRILTSTSTLLKTGGRLNLTLRRVNSA